MSSMEEDDILMDPNGNQAVEIEATTSTTTGFFANILKKVWPSRETKYELKYRTRKASDGAKSDTGSIWSKLTGFLAQDGTSTSSVSSPGTSNASSPRDSIMAEVDDNNDNKNKSFENNVNRHDSAFSVKSSSAVKQEEAAAARPLLVETKTRKSFSEEFKGVRTRKEVLFSKEYRKRRSRNLNELYEHERKGSNSNENGNFNQNYWRQGGGNGNTNNRVSLIVTSPSDENLREENLNEFNNSLRRTDRHPQNYNVNEMDMGFMCRSGMGSDVVITCQGQCFQAHSFVLKAQSGHFRRILFTQSDTTTKPIVINQLLPQDMEALLLYMYTGRIAKNYSTIHGELTQRFEMMLEDFDVPFPDGTEPLCE